MPTAALTQGVAGHCSNLTWGTFCWDGSGLVPGSPSPELLVADSWLVVDNSVRGFEEHRRRFTAACATEAGLEPAAVAEFLSVVIADLPRRGRWFPRVEAGPGRELCLQMRTAPPPAETIRLSVHDGPDPRRRPRVKGPDLEALAAVRERARERGADEAVLLDADGAVLEGALSGIVWWDGDALCVPDPQLPRLDSVTCRLVTALAQAAGHEIRPVRAPLADLDGREVWSLGALHGIRLVTGRIAAGVQAGPAIRAGAYRARLRALARSLPVG